MKHNKILFYVYILILLFLIYQIEGIHLKQEGVILIFSAVLGLLINYVKSYNPTLHKFSVVFGSFLLVLFALVVLETSSPLGYLLFLFPLTLATLGQGIYGGLLVYGLSVLALYFRAAYFGLTLNHLVSSILVLGLASVGLLYYATLHHQMIENNEDWLEKLHVKINEMTLLKEVTSSMQSALDISKLNKIVLTAITAGYGLGFNRALVFLVDGDEVYGEYAIGPSSRAEAYRIWGNVVTRQSNLHEVIDSDDDFDETLLDMVKKIRLSLEMDHHNPIITCVKDKTPRLIHRGDPEQFGPQLSRFNFENYAVVPMISRDRVVGVFLVDNRYNEKPIKDEDLDTLITFSGQSALAFENILLMERVKSLAITDELTTLYNHRYYKESIGHYMKEDIPFTLMVIDVDDFKQFNENYGHAIGDQVLQKVGHTLKKAVGDLGSPFRYGGDEFTIILPRESRETAVIVAKTIQEEILNITLDTATTPLTLSIGVAQFPTDAKCEKELFILADQKLKFAKESGKNTVRWEVPS